MKSFAIVAAGALAFTSVSANAAPVRSAQVIPTVTKSVEVPTKVARASAPVKGESELAGLSLIGLLIGAAVAATIVVVVASDSNG